MQSHAISPSPTVANLLRSSTRFRSRVAIRRYPKASLVHSHPSSTAQRVASPGTVTYERQCAVCQRTLASRLRCYGSRSSDAVFESADQLCYHQRDGPPLGFCGARCHRLFQPWIDVMEECSRVRFGA